MIRNYLSPTLYYPTARCSRRLFRGYGIERSGKLIAGTTTTTRIQIRSGCNNDPHHPHHHFASIPTRSFAVYAVGEGWTGALGGKYVLESIPGHFDEDLIAIEDENNTTVSTTLSPVLLIYTYPSPTSIKQVAVGWGTTAVVDTDGVLKVVGRPHDLMSLLRLNRMPVWMRQWILKKQNEKISSNPGSAICDDAPTTQDTTVTPVGQAISKLIGWATGGVETTAENDDNSNNNNWEMAQKYSNLQEFTTIALPQHQTVKQIACGPGFMSMISQEGGLLYTMGVNNRGQCGVGSITNNVWTPTPVMGLSSKKKKRSSQKTTTTTTDQEHPIVQVALGFQHGYALDATGQVFSWGKAQRGQLGREDVDSDQDAYAGVVKMPNNAKITQISAGHHHGAALTFVDNNNNQVYVWGKNMGRNDENETETDQDESNDDDDASTTSTDAKPIDARAPQLVQGLPSSSKVLQISCGSHHTSILLEDGSVYAMGIASDEAVPILEAVEIIPPGIIELPVRQFEAHQDRTTVVDKDGNVYQAHLWLDPSLREYAYFTPPYVDALIDRGESIQAIHRGWRHTVIVTKD